jgi:AcrR family transcriptional regulator
MSGLPDRGHRAGAGAPAAPAPPRPGLRERTKARTRAAIREHAFRLFREQGYDATTVEQIAGAAEVSPSTFFRYFPTKEDVVLQDGMDARWAEAVLAQPPGLSALAALRAAISTAFAGLPPGELALLRESASLAVSVPAVRARLLDEFGRTIGVIAAAAAQRAGRDPDDLAVRTLAGAVMGVVMTAWFATGDLEGMMAELDRGLALLETGLRL